MTVIGHRNCPWICRITYTTRLSYTQLQNCWCVPKNWVKGVKGHTNAPKPSFGAKPVAAQTGPKPNTGWTWMNLNGSRHPSQDIKTLPFKVWAISEKTSLSLGRPDGSSITSWTNIAIGRLGIAQWNGFWTWESNGEQPLSKKRSSGDFNNYSVVGYKLCLSMYLCIYVSMYLCIYVCMYVCNICMYVCMHACMYVCMHVCTYVRMYVRTYVCMYVLNLNITISYMYICVLYCVQIHMWYMI